MTSGSDDAEALQRYYGEQFDEDARLRTRSAQGALELLRTRALLTARLPAGARILDVGGASGIHARWLQDAGHEVLLIDPVPRHVERATAAGVASEVGDARSLLQDDGQYDAVLLLGPLYHLRRRADRMLALREAIRVLEPGGLVAAGAISRFAALGAAALGRPVGHPVPPAILGLLERGDIDPALSAFPGGHAHTGESLEAELVEAGLNDVEVLAVEGAAGLALESLGAVDTAVLDAAVEIAARLESSPGDRDISNHLLGFGRRAAATAPADPPRDRD